MAADNNFSGIGLGLLRFCLEHSDGTVGETDMSRYQRDPEDYKWLMAALNNLESDTQKMKKLIDQLNQDIPTQEKKYALEGIQYFVEDLDLANDLIKVNGLATMVKFISHEDHDIRLWVAWIIASLTQNNPTTQLALYKLDVFKLLCEALQKETNDLTKDKQLYALSSLTSGNQSLMDLLVDQYNGLSYLTSLVLSPTSSTQFKAIWFIYKLLSLRPSNLNIVRQNTQLLSNLMAVLSTAEKTETRERAISVLSIYIDHDLKTKKDCLSLGLDKLIHQKLQGALDEEKKLLQKLQQQIL